MQHRLLTIHSKSEALLLSTSAGLPKDAVEDLKLEYEAIKKEKIVKRARDAYQVVKVIAKRLYREGRRM